MRARSSAWQPLTPAAAGGGPALPRRDALRLAALAGAGALGALGGTASAAARALPRSAHHPVRLWFLADTDSLETNNLVLKLIQEATAPFVAQNRGVVIQAGFMMGNSVIPSMVGGQGPDVISDWYAAPYWQGNLLLPLDEYMRRDNIDTSVWSRGQLAVMQQPFGTYMLPAYFSPMVHLVRLSDFDELGLEYPSTDWTYKEFADLARQLTVHSQKQTRYGCDAMYGNSGYGGVSWVYQAFGGDLMGAGGTRQTLSAPNSVAAGNWWFETLIWPKVGAVAEEFYGATGADGVLHDQQSMCIIWDGIVLNFAAAARDSFKWAIYPPPVFPSGRMTQGTEDFYGINAQTKYPEQAWALLKWLSYEKTFQQSLMHIGAVPPARNDLWEEWVSTVENIAPPTRGKGMHWFAEVALGGYALPNQYFRYEDKQVQSVDTPWLAKLWNHQVDVAEGFAGADGQANTLLSEAAGATQAQNAVEGLLRGAAGKSVTFPAPGAAGLGVAAAPVRGMVTVKAGVYSVQGAGQGLNGGGDNGTFYCTTETASRGTFTCRLTSISGVDVPQMADGSKIGLMIRADLASAAAACGVVVATGRGVHFFGRSLPASGYGDEGGGAGRPTGAAGAGLFPASEILHPDAAKEANYLLKPVWLRLVRDGGIWTALTSLDGSAWLQAGPSLGIQAAGVWIGLFVTAHNAKLGTSGKRIQATFDHLSGFAPTTAYQLGSP